MALWAWWLILLLAGIGDTSMVLAVINAAYTLGLRQRLWHAISTTLLLLSAAGPVVIVWVVGFHYRLLLPGGSWDAVPALWKAYVAFCGVAVPVVSITILIQRRIDRPKCLISNHTYTHDSVAALGRVPMCDGWRGTIGRIPGNDLYRFDLARRDIRIPHLPEDLKGLFILHLSDLHLNGLPDRSFFEWSLDLCAQEKPDMVALTGDIADHTGVLDWFPSTLGRLTQAPLGCYFILGNHDIDVADAIRSAVESAGWKWIAGAHAVREHRGVPICISGAERQSRGVHPQLPDLALAPFRIHLAQVPHEVRWARRNNIALMLAGHLHGGQIRLPVVGRMGGRLASGLFVRPPTILHVTRGLGQMTPLRFNCRPEAAILILHPDD